MMIMDDKYAYYTDHFSYMPGASTEDRGRHGSSSCRAALDETTWAATDCRQLGAARMSCNSTIRAAVTGMGNGTVRYDPKTEKFTAWGRRRDVRLGSARQCLA
jgi:hypothetical protein